MLCSELDGLKQAQCLVHAAPNGHVVDGGLLQHPLRVDDEQAPQSYSLVLDQDSIPGCNLLQCRAYQSCLVVPFNGEAPRWTSNRYRSTAPNVTQTQPLQQGPSEGTSMYDLKMHLSIVALKFFALPTKLSTLKPSSKHCAPHVDCWGV